MSYFEEVPLLAFGSYATAAKPRVQKVVPRFTLAKLGSCGVVLAFYVTEQQIAELEAMLRKEDDHA